MHAVPPAPDPAEFRSAVAKLRQLRQPQPDRWSWFPLALAAVTMLAALMLVAGHGV